MDEEKLNSRSVMRRIAIQDPGKLIEEIVSLRSQLAARDDTIEMVNARSFKDMRREQDLLNSLESMESRADTAERELAARDERVRLLKLNLMDFGRHLGTCATNPYRPDREPTHQVCSCGLDIALAKGG